MFEILCITLAFFSFAVGGKNEDRATPPPNPLEYSPEFYSSTEGVPTMKRRSVFIQIAISIAGITVPCFALGQQISLHLRHGVYVQQPNACKNPPFAALKVWDGIGFSGAHSSKCTSRVLRLQGSHFTVRTTCAAFGDGSPDPSKLSETVSLNRLSNLQFVLSQDSGPRAIFRWCSAE